MKKLILFTLALIVSVSSFGQTKLYKGLLVGMSKTQAQEEFTKNKEEYTTAQIGAFQYRLYVQNNKYGEDGKLFQIGFVAKGAGLTGVLESEGMDRLRDFVRFAKENGYTSDGISVGASEYQYNKNGEYLFISPEKDKFIKLVFVPNGDTFVFLSLWVGSYSEDVKKSVYQTDDF
jgi:hypothetical protein